MPTLKDKLRVEGCFTKSNKRMVNSHATTLRQTKRQKWFNKPTSVSQDLPNVYFPHKYSDLELSAFRRVLPFCTSHPRVLFHHKQNPLIPRSGRWFRQWHSGLCSLKTSFYPNLTIAFLQPSAFIWRVSLYLDLWALPPATAN